MDLQQTYCNFEVTEKEELPLDDRKSQSSCSNKEMISKWDFSDIWDRRHAWNRQ